MRISFCHIKYVDKYGKRVITVITGNPSKIQLICLDYLR